ncbi:hypothetical protein RclHR1_04010006 [Rhizophagus clarus]|uniref:Uncharacterized protein n=1 Tax=Rhizophagus clarus TaxID=94130 RepID=A0A2Z6S9B1_9GLOM|nr:hypothetical protein RclHR1_04010006 [Rhizophagus clarus]GES95511.1 hypothetical protein GLOIN_2v1798535 [Rhizophagus clarus]
MIKPQILTNNYKKILTILNNIIKNEDNTPFIGYPVLIGSRAAKWHVSSFREPNDWDLIATPLQTTLFINKVEESRAVFKNIKLIHYPGGGLKLVGECTERSTNGKPISFDIEIVSDKVDLRNMKSNVTLSKKESDEESFEDESDEDDNMQDDDHDIEDYDKNFDVDVRDEEEINQIEFEKFNNVQPKISGLMILELCRDIDDKTMFPLLTNFLCIVAPLKILEALKTSHIYWPDDFRKNIGDLHLLRILLDYNEVSVIQPLCSPQRDEQIELMLKTRIKETEIIRDKPGAHINLNMSNEDFLDNEDNLFVQRRVPHDDLHELVKYGDHPIYQGLKDDQSKAWIKKSLFEKLDYRTKLNCVKEEAMAIALERYLIPMISKNQETSYNLALVRICTTLTRGWFRQFAIDNYPRLSNLDKDLLSIAHDVIEKFPIKEKKPDVLKLDPETQAIFESIRPYTEKISSFEELYNLSKYYENDFSRTGIKITSPVNGDISVTAIITILCTSNYDDCSSSADWTASVVILPTKDLEILSDEDENNERIKRREFKDPLNIHPYYNGYHRKFSKLTSKHVFALGIKALTRGGSWGIGEDIWRPMCIKAKSVDYVASMLGIPDLTGDILFKYVLDYLKPTLPNNGETPLKHWVNKLKGKGAIPIEPKQHLWYHAWNYKLNRKSNR